jgi:predicted regulator of Ras-like GTPase activity (Roadblock/LC7/MglB family)
VQNSIQTKFRQVFEKLRNTVADIQAVILVGPEGVIDYMLDDMSLNLETIAGEYATLLHIARSASEDSGSGSLVENIVVSEKSIMLARTIAPEHYLILLARSQDQIGRARYELKQAAWEIQAKRQPDRAQPK